MVFPAVFLCVLREVRLAPTLRANALIGPMQPNEITGQIVDAAYRVHSTMGPGLLESVYEVALDFELKRRGLRSRRQIPIPVEYEGLKFDEGFRADLLVEDAVIVEIKAAEKNHPIHARQLRTHLVLAKLKVGLVLNFGLEQIKDGITRIVNGLPEMKRRRNRAQSRRERRENQELRLSFFSRVSWANIVASGIGG